MKGFRRDRDISRMPPASESYETPREHRKKEARLDQGKSVRRARIRRIVLRGTLIALAVLLISSTAWAVRYYLWVGERLGEAVESDPSIAEALSDEEPGAQDARYVLVLGVDTREGLDSTRADTIMLVRADPAAGTVSVVSVPRDTRVVLEGHGKSRINAAYGYGGAAMMIESVSELTGLPIHDVVLLDFEGFEGMVDAIGGVWVDVPERIEDLMAADYDREAYIVEEGRQLLDGKHALTFVRARHQFARQDLDRIDNQQAFISAFVDQALEIRNPFTLKRLADATVESVSTDMGVVDLYRVVKAVRGSRDEPLDSITVPGEAKLVGNAWYYLVDEEALAEVVQRMESGERADGLVIPEVPEIDPSTVTVAVRNGCGLEGAASGVAEILEGEGFPIREVGNANQFVYDETLIVYDDGDEYEVVNARRAERVRLALGRGAVVGAKSIYQFDTDVLVVVGADYETWADDS